MEYLASLGHRRIGCLTAPTFHFAYEKEIAELKSKYDADKRRWVALKQGGGKAPDVAASDAKGEAKAEPVKDAKTAPKK